MVVKPNTALAPTPEQPMLLDGCVGYHLRRASSRMMNDFLTTLAPLALRPVLFGMLEVIHANPGIIQMALGSELGIQRANLVPLINELSGRGLIERRAAPHDRRAMTLFLTAEGEAFLDQAEALVIEHEERMLAALTPAERSKLLGLLDKIAD